MVVGWLGEVGVAAVVVVGCPELLSSQRVAPKPSLPCPLVAPGVVSGAHHHGDNETSIYVLSGNPVFIFMGDGVQERLETKPGDYAYVPPFVPPHQSNAGSAEEAGLLVTRTAQGPHA